MVMDAAAAAIGEPISAVVETAAGFRLARLERTDDGHVTVAVEVAERENEEPVTYEASVAVADLMRLETVEDQKRMLSDAVRVVRARKLLESRLDLAALRDAGVEL